MKVIKRNIIRCKKCGQTIESKSVHDYVKCNCGSVAVDGGHEYARFTGYPEDYEVLTEYEEVPGYKITHYPSYGGKATFMTNEDWHKLAERYENMWDYIHVEDENGNVLYETKGLDKHKKEKGYH